MTHRLPRGHRRPTACRNGLLGAAALGASILCGPNPVSAQDLAYPRYSPLPVRDAAAQDGTPVHSISLAFGTALQVLEQSQGHAIVVLQDGSQVRVRLSDLFIPPTPSHVRFGAAFVTADRARLSFWDSPLRAEGFLRDGPSAQTRPILQEIGAGGLPALLPVSETIQVPIRADRTVLLAGGLVPMPGETLALLDDTNAAAARPVTLHVIVDGSEYTRDFSQRQLQDLSRMIEAQAADALALPQVSLTVVFNSGAVTVPEATVPSGLRRILPQVDTTENGTLSSALVAALDRLQADIVAASSPDRAHVVLVLLGPGLHVDLLDDPAFLSVAEGLRRIPGDIGLLLGAVTPEPSDIPARLLSRLGGAFPTRLTVFGANLGFEVADMVREVTRTRSAPDIAALCRIAQDRGVPCLSAPDAETLRRLLPVVSDTPPDWFAMPLWYVVDGNLLMMEQRDAVTAVPLRHAPEENAADRLAVAQARADALQIDLTRQQIALQAMEAQVAALREVQARAEQDRNQAAEAASAEMARIEEMSLAALATLEERAAGLDRALADARALNGDLASQTVAREADLRAAHAALAAAEIAADTLRTENFAANGRITTLTRDLADAEARALGTEAELAEVRAASIAQADLIETLDRALTEAVTDSARVEAELVLAQENTALLEAELAATTDELSLSAADLAGLIVQLATQQEVFDTQKVALEAALADALDAQTRAEADLAMRDGQINALEARIVESAEDRTRLYRALEETRRIVARLELDVLLGEEELAEVIADLDRSRDEVRTLRSAEVELLRTLGEDEVDDLRAALAAELSTEQEAHAATRAGLVETEQAIARVLVDLATVLGIDMAWSEQDQSDLDLLAFLVAEVGDQLPRTTETVRSVEAELVEARTLIATHDVERAELRARLATLESENAHLMERMEVAVGVADENMQLIAIVQEAERMMLVQDETHASEIEALRQQLEAALADGSAVGQATIIVAASDMPPQVTAQPQPRPVDLQRGANTPEPERQAAAARPPAALPGSPFVRATDRLPETVPTGAGFFGN